MLATVLCMVEELVGTFESAGRVMVYSQNGSPGPVSFVLVHGIGMGHRVFRDVAEKLGETGLVFAVDLPEFGDSPEPPTVMDMPECGDFLAEFVRSLPVVDPLLVGHSMGTQVVVEAVARHPGLVSRVVLIAPTVNLKERTARMQVWRMVQDLAGESPKVLYLGLVQYLKAGPRWFLRKLDQMLHHQVEDVLPEVFANVLVIRGAEDRVCPRDWVAQVTSLLPNATMQEVAGRGHEAMIRSPDPVAEMIIDHAAHHIR